MILQTTGLAEDNGPTPGSSQLLLRQVIVRQTLSRYSLWLKLDMVIQCKLGIKPSQRKHNLRYAAE